MFVPYEEVSATEKKTILKKLIGYCIPFIVINVANSIYNTVDMILVIKGLNWIGYPAQDIETISSVFTTWGSKLVSVVTAIATGLVISLIPTIVESYTKNDMKEVNSQFNKTLQVLFICYITAFNILKHIFKTSLDNILWRKLLWSINI